MVKVLIIEDDSSARLVTKLHLRNEYQVVEASDGMEAMELLKHQSVDLIIADVMMPKMNGYEFVEQFRMMDKNTHGAKRKKKIGTIRWAVVLAFIVTFFSVVSYLLTMAIRYYYYGHASDNVFVWSVAIYQIMGSLCGAVIAVISVMLYHRMEKLLNGMEDVANGKLDVEIPLENSGEYKVIYENFNQMVRELKNADEQQKQFMKDFSHEFKTPIHSIKGMAEYLLHNEIPREEEKEYLNVMAEEAGRLAQLSQNTLLLSKLDHMEVLRKKEEFRLDSQIRDCAILLMPSFEEKNIQLEAELPEMKFYGNEELMKEVWVNLLDNARKYSSEGNLVFVEGKVTQDDLWITVRDEGQGMDEQTKQHLFERYYQGDASHETSGFGMGLPIVKRIVELSGGTIWVESTLGKGTTVTIFLKLI